MKLCKQTNERDQTKWNFHNIFMKTRMFIM